MWHSILQAPRCRIHSFSFLRSTYIGRLKESLFTPRISFREASHAHNKMHAIRWLSIGQKACDIRSIELSNGGHEFLDTTHHEKQDMKNKPAARNFTSIQFSDAEPIILEMGNSKCLVRVFVLDIETTGFSRDERIIEIAIRDLSGGNASCLQTLLNPQRNVPNSHIHGITTEMVNQPYVPRMEDLIPILFKYVNSRLQPGEIPIFAAHNARRFDVPFILKEFRRCSMNIPENWRFLDTLPLAREWMKQNVSVSAKASLQALREYFEIPLMGSAHRAMSDVNSLALILERITSDMKLTFPDLLERSFSANCLDSSKKSNKKYSL